LKFSLKTLSLDLIIKMILKFKLSKHDDFSQDSYFFNLQALRIGFITFKYIIQRSYPFLESKAILMDLYRIKWTEILDSLASCCCQTYGKIK